MQKKAPTLVILAAGMGSRYGGLKQVDRLGPSGETIIDYSVFDAIRAGFGKVVLVIRKSIEKDFLETYGDGFLKAIPSEIVFQELDMLPEGFSLPADRSKPWGTAHAIWVARHVVDTDFVVINADDFYDAPSYRALANFIADQQKPGNMFAMCGYRLQNTLSLNGTVSRGICMSDEQGLLQRVEEHQKIGYSLEGKILSEHKDTSIELSADVLVSMNIWAFSPLIFDYIEHYFRKFLAENANDPKRELFTPLLVDMLIRDRKVNVKVLATESQWFGVTYSEDKPAVKDKLAKLVAEGSYPSPLWK